MQNVDFFLFFRTFILWCIKRFFLSLISKNVCCWLSLLKKTYKKKVYFLTKTMDKMSIFSSFLELHFSGLKSILFYPEYQKLFVSGIFFWKKSYKKKVDFFTKAMDWPICKKAIFSTLLEFHFSGLKNILYFPEYQKLFFTGFFR